MPYNDIKSLPDPVRAHLPQHAQEIYKEAFNNAWDEYKDPEDRRDSSSQDQTAHKVAWSAVKRSYVKDDDSGNWVPKHKK
ncbi:hypothetical protein BGZ70_004002 [Mortierella alpina]|uniref:Cation transport regulator ChaB n=1 Tax=Mortierella alpina TaxID=64518 RepID=A0A9P6IRX9_MORAP|nr:hypothetical protein BGZ70_004002 [Mortierella alpina]